MSAAEALKAARAAGISVEIEGDDLVLQAPAAAPPAVLNLLSHHKASIIAMLRWRNGGREFAVTQPLRTTKTLRAAVPIEEADSASWHANAEDLRRRIATALDRLAEPRSHTGRLLMAETRAFLRSDWFSDALKYGWSLEELFGVDSCLPLDNFEHWWLIVGLALAPRACDVIEHLNAEHAIIRHCVSEPFKEARRIEQRFTPADTSVVWWECLALVGDH